MTQSIGVFHWLTKLVSKLAWYDEMGWTQILLQNFSHSRTLANVRPVGTLRFYVRNRLKSSHHFYVSKSWNFWPLWSVPYPCILPMNMYTSLGSSQPRMCWRYDEYIPGACCPRLSTSSPYASICTLWVSPEISLSHNNELASHKLRCTSLYNKLLYLLITQNIYVTEAGSNRGEIILYFIRGQECTLHKDTYEQCPFKPLCLRCLKCRISITVNAIHDHDQDLFIGW